MRCRFVKRPLIVAGGLALLVAACSSPRVSGDAAGTSVPPAAANNASAGADREGNNNGVTVAPTARTYVSTRSLNLRGGPNHRFAAIAVLPPGTTVTPDGYVSGSWWGVITRLGNGWVDSTGLSPG
jgi:hypothetical protein